MCPKFHLTRYLEQDVGWEGFTMHLVLRKSDLDFWVFTEIGKWSLFPIWFLEHFIPLLDVYFRAHNDTHWVLFDLPLQSQLVSVIILIITLTVRKERPPKIIPFTMKTRDYFRVSNLLLWESMNRVGCRYIPRMSKRRREGVIQPC